MNKLQSILLNFNWMMLFFLFFTLANDNIVSSYEGLSEAKAWAINQQDCQTSYSTIHWAVENRHASMVKHLIDQGAEINNPTYLGRLTPLHIAVMNKDAEIANLLLSYGADQNVKNDDGQTSLELMIENGLLSSLLTDLEAKGTKIDLNSAKKIAEQYGKQDVVKLLDNFELNQLHIANLEASSQTLDTLLTIAGDLGSISPFGPYITFGIDLIKIFTGEDSSSSVDDVFVNFQNEITSLKAEIIAWEMQQEQDRINSWIAVVESCQDKMRDYFDEIAKITNQEELKTFIGNYWKLEDILTSLTTTINTIKLEGELGTGNKYVFENKDYSVAEAKFNVLVQACIIRSGIANLRIKESLILFPDADQIQVALFNELKKYTSDSVTLLATALKNIDDRLNPNVIYTPYNTSDFVLVAAGAAETDQDRMDHTNTPTMGFVDYTNSAFDLFGEHKTQVKCRVTNANDAPNHERSTAANGIIRASAYPIIEISDHLTENKTVFYFDCESSDSVVLNSGQPSQHHESFSQSKTLPDRINSEMAKRVAQGQQKITDLRDLSNTMNKFSSQIAIWDKGMMPKAPTNSLKIDAFTQKAQPGTFWALPKVSVQYGVEYMNAIGRTSGIKWGDVINCSGQSNPKLLNIPAPSADEDTYVAVIRIHRKFIQPGQENTPTIVDILFRTEDGRAFPTMITDNDAGKISNK